MPVEVVVGRGRSEFVDRVPYRHAQTTHTHSSSTLEKRTLWCNGTDCFGNIVVAAGNGYISKGHSFNGFKKRDQSYPEKACKARPIGQFDIVDQIAGMD
ncbi:MAG: hypothetical protein STSR0007_07230 [Thermovirga sp.]